MEPSNHPLERKMIFQTSIIMVHVNLAGSIRSHLLPFPKTITFPATPNQSNPTTPSEPMSSVHIGSWSGLPRRNEKVMQKQRLQQDQKIIAEVKALDAKPSSSERRTIRLRGVGGWSSIIIFTPHAHTNKFQRTKKNL